MVRKENDDQRDNESSYTEEGNDADVIAYDYLKRYDELTEQEDNECIEMEEECWGHFEPQHYFTQYLELAKRKWADNTFSSNNYGYSKPAKFSRYCW